MTATPAEVVLDASVAVRGLLGDDTQATGLMNEITRGGTAGHAPDLIVSEVTNALRVRIDAERWPLAAAQERLETFLASPLAIHESGALALLALPVAVERAISAYDALYAVLAEALEIPLVTADRRLAAVVSGALLVE